MTMVCECGHPLMYHTLLYPPTAGPSCVKSFGAIAFMLAEDAAALECDCLGWKLDETKPWHTDDDHVLIRLKRAPN